MEKNVGFHQVNPTYKEGLPEDTILLSQELKDVLQQQCDRLSEIEKQVMSLLARESEPVNLAKLLENGTMPASN